MLIPSRRVGKASSLGRRGAQGSGAAGERKGQEFILAFLISGVVV